MGYGEIEDRVCFKRCLGLPGFFFRYPVALILPLLTR
jgi:hypothetical protein